MIILLHSSKTMRSQPTKGLRSPQLIEQSQEVGSYLKTLSVAQVAKVMHISGPLAAKTHQLVAIWSPEPTSLALDSFIGDIYRGLRASSLSQAERDYADQHLYILSGLYGCLRPYDGIQPYRLEMACKLPKAKFANLYKYWGKSIASCLPGDQIIVNVSSVEYSKSVLSFIDPNRVVTPEFLTVTNGQAGFTAVHAKVARGAFARWMIQNRVETIAELQLFNELGYHYDAKLSKPGHPTFICQEFGGIGLRV